MPFSSSEPSDQSRAELVTSRLLLRVLREKDLPALVAVAGERRIADTTISVPHPFSDADGLSLIARAQSAHARGFGIFDSGGSLVGYAGLHHIDLAHAEAEISFWIGSLWEGRGFVTEAAHRLMRFGFNELKLNRICAFHMVRNPASERVLSRLGFTEEGRLRERVRKWDAFEDVKVWSRLRHDPLPPIQ